MARAARRVGLALVVLALLVGGAWLGLRRLAPHPQFPPRAEPVADPASRRTLADGGEVVGFVGRYGSHVWLGIPYAAPPVGKLRWRAPAPPAPWQGVRQSLAFGNHCPQLASPFGGVRGKPGTLSGSEDCLYLNVYAPRVAPEAVPRGAERLPVMVWIHGGGNVIGLSDFYDGGRLAAEQGVVVVTFNYRLGPFGWFRSAALRAGEDSPEGRSGNFGTLDIIRALRWVHDNAGAFGGDPGRVTVFGESAGGTDVYSLLLSPPAAGLFQRAIVESGGLGLTTPARAENWTDDPEPGHRRSSNEVIGRLLVAGGRAPDRAAAKELVASMPPAQLAGWLRSETPEQIFAAYARDPHELLLDMPRVFADGVVLPTGDPLARLASPDGWNRVPVLVGTNHDEDMLFLFPNPLYVRMWLGMIPRVRDPDLYLATAEALSTMWKATGADAPAAAMWRTQPDVYVYRFDWNHWPRLLGFDAQRFLGAAHGFEIPFVFGHWDLGPRGAFLFDDANREAREALSRAMRSYWTEFAATGRPGSGRDRTLPLWTAWDGRPQAPDTMLLDAPAGGGLRMGSERTTVAAVLEAVETEPRLHSARDRCWVYRELASHSRGLTAEGYAAVGHGECAAFPFDGFPWR
jgi:para-nitrobenzyl esterase